MRVLGKNKVVALGMAVFCACAAFGSAGFGAARVKLGQTVSLQAGWNAVYIQVAPEATADEVFGSWPVDNVAVYNPSAFLETAQYSGTDSNEGTSKSGYRMWRRGNSALSQVQSVPANCVCVCYSTNKATFAATLYGVPSAPRNTWHISSTGDGMNFIGLAVAGDATTTVSDYFDGIDAGSVSYYTVNGGYRDRISTMPLTAMTKLVNGQAIAATASKISDWSGVFRVTPAVGLDFSTNLACQTFSVRNESTKARTVELRIGTGYLSSIGDLATIPTGLMMRDTSANSNTWQAFSPSFPIRRVIAVGETVTWQMALDRTKLGGAAGAYYGGLMTVKDVDGGSGMCVTVPVEATSDGGDSGEFAWPKGVWLLSGKLTRVSYFDADETRDAVAGGQMPVRLILYAGPGGDMKLLQRITFGADTNGVTRVYSGEMEGKPHDALTNAKRISAALLPIDQPVITGEEGGAFGTAAAFDFTVSEDSKVNPFRHVYHPSHDGLKWDFATATPSGDDMQNYVSTVKPEMFSVGNRIELQWDGTTGRAWSPDEKVTGDLTWKLSGLRHMVGTGDAGTITMKGRFTMKRISSVSLDK